MISERERKQLDEASLRLFDLYTKKQHAHLLNEVEVLSKSGDVPPAALGLAALSLVELERYQEALTAVQEAVQRAPGQAWVLGALAAVEAGQGHLEAAIEAQRKAMQLMPGEPGYAAELAQYQRRAGRPDQAARTARQALMVDAGHAGALNELGLALAAGGDREGALEQLRLAQEAAPSDPAGFLNEGAVHLGAGARREARRALHAALERQPGLPEAENSLAETLAGTKGPGRAVLVHLLDLGRVTIVGWLMIAFLYYLLFRLLEFLWKAVPATMPYGRGLLLVTLAYLLGGLCLGRLLRFAFRQGWPN